MILSKWHVAEERLGRHVTGCHHICQKARYTDELCADKTIVVRDRFTRQFKTITIPGGRALKDRLLEASRAEAGSLRALEEE